MSEVKRLIEQYERILEGARLSLEDNDCQFTRDKICEYEIIIDALRRAEPDTGIPRTENNHLTLDELRGMDGEPVWVSFLNSKVSISGQWHLVRNITDEVINCFENYMPFCDYGKTWLAYRRKKEDA